MDIDIDQLVLIQQNITSEWSANMEQSLSYLKQIDLHTDLSCIPLTDIAMGLFNI